jgi:GNAT superfamily N-acetyltransferase
VISGFPVPTLNGVWLERQRPGAAAVASLLAEIAPTGLPYCLQLRPRAGTALSELEQQRNMTFARYLPLMALPAAEADRIPAAADQPGIAVRQLGPEEMALHATVASAAFGMTTDLALQLCSPDAMRRGLIYCYMAEMDGRPVSTSVGMTVGGFTGIFSVATMPGFRGRGLSTAITARAVADGLAAGAVGAWLQSSPEGYHVHEKLGFRAVETWQVWVTA